MLQLALCLFMGLLLDSYLYRKMIHLAYIHTVPVTILNGANLSRRKVKYLRSNIFFHEEFQLQIYYHVFLSLPDSPPPFL